MTNMVYYIVHLSYYPMEWKKACEIHPEKRRKCDFKPVRSYQVISLLNYIGKIVEKVVAQKLS